MNHGNGPAAALMNPLASRVLSKMDRLRSLLAELDSAAVALSGGLDSSVLLCVARECIGKGVVAVTARSEVMPRSDLELSAQLAAKLSVAHWVLDFGEMSLEAFVSNGPDRCYVCKRARYVSLLDLLKRRGIAHLLDGSNADDEADYRPGARAVRQLGIRTPLQEVGLSKEEIRIVARHLGLDCWDKPASACLASRIPYGSRITPEKLEQVEKAEEFLGGLKIARQLRVRHHGDLARIEVDESSLAPMMEEAVRRSIVEHMAGLGFTYVTLDLQGYRMGSLNAALGRRSDLG